MGYYVNTVITICSDSKMMRDNDYSYEFVKKKLSDILKELPEDDRPPIDEDDPSHCLSQALCARKGGNFVISGVFNYWGMRSALEFAQLLSRKFESDVMVMSWDQEQDLYITEIYENGISPDHVKQILEPCDHQPMVIHKCIKRTCRHNCGYCNERIEDEKSFDDCVQAWHKEKIFGVE